MVPGKGKHLFFFFFLQPFHWLRQIIVQVLRIGLHPFLSRHTLLDLWMLFLHRDLFSQLYKAATWSTVHTFSKFYQVTVQSFLSVANSWHKVLPAIILLRPATVLFVLSTHQLYVFGFFLCFFLCFFFCHPSCL